MILKKNIYSELVVVGLLLSMVADLPFHECIYIV